MEIVALFLLAKLQNLQNIYQIDMYEGYLALNNVEGLMCHKTEPTNQPKIVTDSKKAFTTLNKTSVLLV